MNFFDVVGKRFSCRNFSDEKATDNDLSRILDAGMMAPVGRGKYEDVHITVIRNKSLLDEISKLSDKSLFYNADILIIISSHDDGFGLGDQNCGCVAENMLLAASALGLGSIYLNLVIGFIKNNEDILNKLNLPEGFTPVVGVGIGHFKEELIKTHKIDVNYI